MEIPQVDSGTEDKVEHMFGEPRIIHAFIQQIFVKYQPCATMQVQK